MANFILLRTKAVAEALLPNLQLSKSPRIMNVSLTGGPNVTEALIPLFQLFKSPRIVNVSSTGGDLILLHNEKMREELQDIEKLTDEKVDEIIRLFI
nr:hypothetical protein [Tanacetum cinerariifolium]